MENVWKSYGNNVERKFTRTGHCKYVTFLCTNDMWASAKQLKTCRCSFALLLYLYLWRFNCGFTFTFLNLWKLITYECILDNSLRWVIDLRCENVTFNRCDIYCVWQALSISSLAHTLPHFIYSGTYWIRVWV